MNGFPSNCLDCDYYKTCNSAMYMEGCVFYRPEDKPKTFIEKIKNFLKRLTF